MKVAIPAVTGLCFEPQQLENIFLFPQKIPTDQKSVYLSKNNIFEFNSKDKPIRYEPISIRELVKSQSEIRGATERLLLYPEHYFEMMPPANSVNSSIDQTLNLHHFSLNSIGHCFAFLVSGIVYVIKKYDLSISHIEHLINFLNNNLYVYVLCGRNRCFEPNLSTLWEIKSSLLDTDNAYHATQNGWIQFNQQDILTQIRDMSSLGINVWVDVVGSFSTANAFVNQVRQISQEPICRKPQKLPYTSPKLPKSFSLVTIAPDRNRISKHAQQILKRSQQS